MALFMALFMVALVAMAGLVIDGGAALAARGQAADVAQQAARAAADSLAPESLRASSPADLRINTPAATAAAAGVLAAAGATGQVEVNGTEVSVTAHMPRRSVVLSAFGVNDIGGTATGTATVLHGTTTGRTP